MKTLFRFLSGAALSPRPLDAARAAADREAPPARPPHRGRGPAHRDRSPRALAPRLTRPRHPRNALRHGDARQRAREAPARRRRHRGAAPADRGGQGEERPQRPAHEAAARADRGYLAKGRPALLPARSPGSSSRSAASTAPRPGGQHREAWAKEAGVEKNVSCHTFRHSWRRTSSGAAPTSARSRRCSATPASRRRSVTRTWRCRTSARRRALPTREADEAEASTRSSRAYLGALQAPLLAQAPRARARGPAALLRSPEGRGRPRGPRDREAHVTGFAAPHCKSVSRRSAARSGDEGALPLGGEGLPRALERSRVLLCDPAAPSRCLPGCRGRSEAA